MVTYDSAIRAIWATVALGFVASLVAYFVGYAIGRNSNSKEN